MSGSPWWPLNRLTDCDNKPRKGCNFPAVYVVGYKRFDGGTIHIKRLCYDCVEWELWGNVVIAKTLVIGEGHTH